MHLKISSAKWWPFCPRGDELTDLTCNTYLTPFNLLNKSFGILFKFGIYFFSRIYTKLWKSLFFIFKSWRHAFLKLYNHKNSVGWVLHEMALEQYLISCTWRRHQMEAFSALLAICVGNSPVTGEFPAQRPVTRSFDVFFDLRLNKRLSKQSWGWWFETLSGSLWRHCNDQSKHLPPAQFWGRFCLFCRGSRVSIRLSLRFVKITRPLENKRFEECFPINLQFIPDCPLKNMSVLVQLMAKCRKYDKPSPDPKFRDLDAM